MHVHATPHHRYLEIQQSVQLVLNDGQRLNQLLRVHGAHHAIDPDHTENASVMTGKTHVHKLTFEAARLEAKT